MSLRIACVVALAALALTGSALEAPSGVIAVLDPEVGADHHERACGGAATMIGPGAVAITLEEVVPAGVESVQVVMPGGARRAARVERRGARTGAVLLRLDLPDDQAPTALPLADSARIAVGDAVWTVGNSFGVIEQDGVAALSRGIVSGLYDLASDAPPVRGRLGRTLSTYHGAVIETDAAINDGNQGGPLVDDAGRVLGLVSLGLARERRLGTVVPIHLIAADLGLQVPLAPPAGATDAVEARLAELAAQRAGAVVLLYLERPNGLGNPPGAPRPPPLTDATPLYERERLERQWDRYYHDQQVFYTDQPVTGLVVGESLVLTSASNLHGGAKHGRVLIEGRPPVDADLVATDAPLDLALFRTVAKLPVKPVELADDSALAVGDPVALIGRHRAGLGHTLTTGVVSAATRRRDQAEVLLGQTDALADYGNLGGPVIDLDGSVVGLMTMLGPEGDWPWLINSGVALFTPAPAIRDALPSLERGKDRREPPSFGLGVKLTYDRAGHRLVVSELVDDMGAKDAGMAEGDLLLSVDGVDARSHAAVTRALLKHAPGDQARVKVKRGDAEVELEVELREFK